MSNIVESESLSSGFGYTFLFAVSLPGAIVEINVLKNRYIISSLLLLCLSSTIYKNSYISQARSKFPIIAANDSIAHKLGMLHPGKGTNTVRAVFVVDPDGINRLILYYPQEIGRNMDEVVRATRALIVSDKNGVAVPAGWPNNELISDRVIVPPPSSEEEAKKRLEEYDCYDWWFCHKPLDS